MADKGFNFPPPERRSPKGFEPPPWERERFEELRRQRGEGAETEPTAPGNGAEQEPQPAPEQAPPAASTVPRENEQPADAPGNTPRADQPSEKQVVAMLTQLAAEEEPVGRAVGVIALSAAVVTGGIGALLLIWGIAGLVGSARTGAIGMFGGSVLVLFGAGFIALAAWLAARTLRQQGVL